MGLCFVCNEKLNGHYVRLSTTRTSYGHELLIEKIADLLGEEIVIIVNNNDLACNNCASVLNQIDKLEFDLKLVKNTMLSSISKKYGIPFADEDVEAVKVEEEQLESDEESSVVSNPLTLIKPEEIQQINNPIKLSNVQNKPQQVLKPQPSEKQLQVMLPHQVPKQTQEQNSQLLLKQQQIEKQQNAVNSWIIHKSDSHVQNHVPTSNKIEPEKPIIVTQNAVKKKTLVPQQQKNTFFRCQVCAKTFESRGLCLEHIQKEHNKPTLNKLERKIECSRTDNQKVESFTHDNHLDKRKSNDTEQEKETKITKKSEETEITVKDEETEITVKSEKTEITEKGEETEITVKSEETEITVKSEETEITEKGEKTEITEKGEKTEITEKGKKTEITKKGKEKKNSRKKKNSKRSQNSQKS